MGLVEELLVKQGWQQVGGGHWVNPETDGGEQRYSFEGAIAREHERLVGSNYRIQNILDKTRSALGLGTNCQYKDMPDSATKITTNSNRYYRIVKETCSILTLGAHGALPEAARNIQEKFNKSFAAVIRIRNTLGLTCPVDEVPGEVEKLCEKLRVHEENPIKGCACLSCDPEGKKKPRPLCPNCNVPMTNTSDALGGNPRIMCEKCGRTEEAAITNYPDTVETKAEDTTFAFKTTDGRRLEITAENEKGPTDKVMEIKDYWTARRTFKSDDRREKTTQTKDQAFECKTLNVGIIRNPEMALIDRVATELEALRIGVRQRLENHETRFGELAANLLSQSERISSLEHVTAGHIKKLHDLTGTKGFSEARELLEEADELAEGSRLTVTPTLKQTWHAMLANRRAFSGLENEMDSLEKRLEEHVVKVLPCLEEIRVIVDNIKHNQSLSDLKERLKKIEDQLGSAKSGGLWFVVNTISKRIDNIEELESLWKEEIRKRFESTGGDIEGVRSAIQAIAVNFRERITKLEEQLGQPERYHINQLTWKSNVRDSINEISSVIGVLGKAILNSIFEQPIERLTDSEIKLLRKWKSK